MAGKCKQRFFWKQKQITQNFNNQQLIDVGLNLSDYKLGQEHKGKYEKNFSFKSSSASVQVRRNTAPDSAMSRTVMSVMLGQGYD